MTGAREHQERRELDAPRPAHRLGAVAALVCVPLGAALVLAAVIEGLPWLLVPALLLAGAVYAGWKALVRRGIRRRLYAVLAPAALLAAVVVTALVGVEVRLLGAGVALLVAGGAAAVGALAWTARPSGRLVGPARHPVLLVNPRSGDGVAEDTDLVAAARQRGIRVVEVHEGDDLPALARREARRGADCLGMAGGDGSLAAVATEAMRAHVPFVCVPAGTRNHFALDLGLDRSDPVAALDAFGEAFQRRIDVGVVNGRVFLNNVSMGAYGEVVADEQYRERKLGTALERIPEVVGPDAEPLDLRFVDGDGERHDTAAVIQVSNNRYDLTPVPGFGSRPSLTDGRLGVVVVQTGAGDRPIVAQWEAPTFEVDSDGPVAAGVDGEAVHLDPPVRFGVRPAALRVRMPRDVAGVSPAAKRPPLTVATVRRLLVVAGGRAPEGTGGSPEA